MIKKKENSLIVLEALLLGIPIHYCNRIWYLGENNDLVIEGTHSVGSVQSACYLRTDTTFAGFINLCSKLTDDEMTEITLSMSLLNIQRENEGL